MGLSYVRAEGMRDEPGSEDDEQDDKGHDAGVLQCRRRFEQVRDVRIRVFGWLAHLAVRIWVRHVGGNRFLGWAAEQQILPGRQTKKDKFRMGEFLKGYMRKKLGWVEVGRVILRMAILAALLRRATKRRVIEARISGA